MTRNPSQSAITNTENEVPELLPFLQATNNAPVAPELVEKALPIYKTLILDDPTSIADPLFIASLIDELTIDPWTAIILARRLLAFFNLMAEHDDLHTEINTRIDELYPLLLAAIAECPMISAHVEDVSIEDAFDSTAFRQRLKLIN